MTSWVHGLDIRTRSGSVLRTVVRRYRTELFDTPERAEREWKVLSLLAGTAVPAPEPLWFDQPGSLFGRPALLMTRLPGRPMVDPGHPTPWLTTLADTLAGIHSLPVERFRPIGEGEAWQAIPFDRSDRVGESFTRAGLDGEAVVAAIQHGYRFLRPGSRRLVHFDYWPGNVLWSRGKLAGVVDWANAVIGYADYDAAYCFLDLSLSRGRREAMAFLRRYREVSGVDVEPLWFWSLATAERATPDPAAWIGPYAELGRRNLTARQMRSRFRSFVQAALNDSPMPTAALRDR